MKTKNFTVEIMENRTKKLIEIEFEDSAIGTAEKIEFLQQQVHNTLDAMLPLSKKRQNQKQAG